MLPAPSSSVFLSLAANIQSGHRQIGAASLVASKSTLASAIAHSRLERLGCFTGHYSPLLSFGAECVAGLFCLLRMSQHGMSDEHAASASPATVPERRPVGPATSAQTLGKHITCSIANPLCLGLSLFPFAAVNGGVLVCFHLAIQGLAQTLDLLPPVWQVVERKGRQSS